MASYEVARQFPTHGVIERYDIVPDLAKEC